jgi:hypothetical protein
MILGVSYNSYNFKCNLHFKDHTEPELYLGTQLEPLSKHIPSR